FLRRALRDGHGYAGLPRRNGRGIHARDSQGRAAGRRCARPRRHDPALPGEGAGAALPIGQGPAVCALTNNSHCNQPAAPTQTANPTPAYPGVPGHRARTAVATIQLTDEPRIDLGNVRFENITAEFDSAANPVWSPDGRSLAFWAFGRGLMLRSLDSDQATLIAHGFDVANPPVFSADGRRLFHFTIERADTRKLWSTSLAGGKRELVLQQELTGFTGMDGLAVTPDSESLLIVQEHAPARFSFWTSTPPGTALKRHADFESSFPNLGRARLRFSHDGHQLLMMLRARGFQRAELWTMDWPFAGTPHQVLSPITQAHPSLISAEWMRDNRHLLLSSRIGNTNDSDTAVSLIADLETGKALPIGPLGFHYAASRDFILANTLPSHQEIVELPLDGSLHRDPIADRRGGHHPAWSHDGQQIAYVNRDGLRLWNRALRSSRVVVRPDALPAEEQSLTSVSFTPDGLRLLFASNTAVWVVPATGGAPTRILTGLDRISSPLLSPDRQSVVYRVHEQDHYSLIKTRLGDTTQARIKITTTAQGFAPVWSPDGRYIAMQDKEGLALISPSGEDKRVLAQLAPSAAVWSADSRTLYLVDRNAMFSKIDIASGLEQRLADHSRVGIGTQTISTNRPSLSLDGKSILLTRISYDSHINLIGGLEPPTTFWQRLFRRKL
ncbi:MAG: PD40 domain-containing protein, partial [Bryobacterales bacterium]|nr:PD40 domain-containing protein [Bryobacterales bacterium]